ncbi:helix-turn-helix domain-containing protein [Jiangella endophytica]|uniref:helix-turn-helix domain-containing protein n=1 Tax=Jiangella endophytica TaxID=1623398 RepID=UPI0018E5392B|nr:ImmA/IrrE family metallo-endopeptidase [Jiangella endophytica]
MSAARPKDSFNPQRLRLARELRGITKEALARACGVSRRAVTDWESGKVEEPRVDAISAALAFPESFFFGDDLAEVTEDDASFRAYSALSARRSKSVLALASITRGVFSWMDEHYETPSVDIPKIGDLLPVECEGEPDPVQSAYSLRSIWGLSARPIVDMMALLESRGVRILALPGSSVDIDAFSFWREGRPIVFLDLGKSAERLRFDLAHELGHLVMHYGVRTRGERTYEAAANIFASTFLIPTDGILAQIRARPTLDDVFTLKRHWKVSATAMVRRLHQLGSINDWQYRTWMVDLSSRGFRSSEPGGIDREMSTLLQRVLALAREDGWRLRRLASELRVPLQDLEGVLAGLAVIPVDGSGEDAPRSLGHLTLVKGTKFS